MGSGLGVLSGGLNLVKIIIGMAPEPGPPCSVHFADIIVELLPEVIPEGVGAELAAAVAAVFIGDVPGDHGFVLSVALRQPGVHFPNLPAVGGRGQAVVVPGTEMLPDTVGTYPQHLRILFRQPPGTGTGGCGQDHFAAGLPHPVDHFVQEGEIILPFPGLQHGPGEDADAHLVAVSKPHQFHILIPDGLVRQPLLRVIVRSVEKMRITGTGVFLVGHKLSSQNQYRSREIQVTTLQPNWNSMPQLSITGTTLMPWLSTQGCILSGKRQGWPSRMAQRSQMAQASVERM